MAKKSNAKRIIVEGRGAITLNKIKKISYTNPNRVYRLLVRDGRVGFRNQLNFYIIRNGKIAKDETNPTYDFIHYKARLRPHREIEYTLKNRW